MTDGMKPIDHDVLKVRALLAVTFALARYVPIPFVDDLVRERVGRMVVERAAKTRNVVLDPAEATALGASPFGCVGCLFAMLWAPVWLLLYPVRAIVGLVRGLARGSRDLVEIFALGRTVERLLDDGRYPQDAPLEARLAYARDVRFAFDAARDGVGTHAVQGLLSVALGPVRAVLPMAMRSIRNVWHGELAPERAAPDAPASRLVAALEDPRMKDVLEKIDRRFDELLLARRATSPGR